MHIMLLHFQLKYLQKAVYWALSSCASAEIEEPAETDAYQTGKTAKSTSAQLHNRFTVINIYLSFLCVHVRVCVRMRACMCVHVIPRSFLPTRVIVPVNCSRRES